MTEPEFVLVSDEQIVAIGKRAMDKCHGTDAQHIYIAREVERLVAASPQPPHTEAPAAQDEREVTDAMVAAYLQANDEYWKGVDQLAPKLGTWRSGTPKEATRVSLRAALAARAPQAAAEGPDEREALAERVLRVLDDADYPREDLSLDDVRLLALLAARAPQAAAEGQAEQIDALEKALAECREAFPVPEPGHPLEGDWTSAMSDPLSVPEYVRACVAAAEGQALTTCNCRWHGEKLVQQCTLHEAWRDAIHDWAERAKAAEAKLASILSQAAAPQPTVQAEAVQTLRERIREEFQLVAGLGRSACINSAMLNVDALISALSAPPVGEPVAHTALKQIQQHLRTTSYHPVKDRIFEIVDQYFDGAPSAPAGEKR